MNTTQKQFPTISLGQLRKHLELYSDDYEVYFGGLEFYRTKTIDHANKIVRIEFNQQVYQQENGDVVIENLQ